MVLNVTLLALLFGTGIMTLRLKGICVATEQACEAKLVMRSTDMQINTF